MTVRPMSAPRSCVMSDLPQIAPMSIWRPFNASAIRFRRRMIGKRAKRSSEGFLSKVSETSTRNSVRSPVPQ
jgi:hypothetical protein